MTLPRTIQKVLLFSVTGLGTGKAQFYLQNKGGFVVWVFFYLFVTSRVSLCSHGWPDAQYVDQDASNSQRFTCLYLPSTKIKGCVTNARPYFWFLTLSIEIKLCPWVRCHPTHSQAPLLVQSFLFTLMSSPSPTPAMNDHPHVLLVLIFKEYYCKMKITILDCVFLICKHITAPSNFKSSQKCVCEYSQHYYPQ